jgi:hypothetical protein
MKDRRSPRYPPCSEAGAKLRSPVSAFFGKIAEGHAAGHGHYCLERTMIRLAGAQDRGARPRPWAAPRLGDRSSPVWRDIGPLNFSPPHPAYSRSQLLAKAAIAASRVSA